MMNGTEEQKIMKIFQMNSLSEMITKSENKSGLQTSQILYVTKEVLQNNKEVFYSFGQKCVNISTRLEFKEFHMLQVEADAIMLHLKMMVIF